ATSGYDAVGFGEAKREEFENRRAASHGFADALHQGSFLRADEEPLALFAWVLVDLRAGVIEEFRAASRITRCQRCRPGCAQTFRDFLLRRRRAYSLNSIHNTNEPLSFFSTKWIEHGCQAMAYQGLG